MDRYPNLRTLLNAEFGSIYRFCREADLPQSTVKHLILGDLGPAAELNAIRRVEAALMKLRPELDLNGVWAKVERRGKNELVVEVPEGTRRIRLSWTVTISFE